MSKTPETFGPVYNPGSSEGGSLIHITTHRLNGTDFLRWAQSFKDFIREQAKIA